MILAVTYRDTITLGTLLVAFFVGLPGIVGLFYGAKRKAEAVIAEENSKVLAEGRAAYKGAAERLGAEKAVLQTENAALTAKIEELRNRPDLTSLARLIEQVLIGQEKAEGRTIEAFEQHEQRAQERHEAEMNVMRTILNWKVGP